MVEEIDKQRELDLAFLRRLKRQPPAGIAKVNVVHLVLLTLLLAPLLALEYYLTTQGGFVTGTCVTAVFFTAYVCSYVFSVKHHNETRLLLDRAKIERSLTSYQTPVESTHWIAAMLDFFWEDLIEEKIATNVYNVISEKIAANKPAFVSKMEIESCGFGSTPPSVQNFVVLGTDDKELKVVEFDVDFHGKDFRLIIKAVGSDDYMLLKNRSFSIKITALGFRFRARAYIHKSANLVFATAASKPTFYLFDTHMMGISPKAIPFFNFKDFVEKTFEKVLVEPKRQCIPLEEKILGPMPEPQSGTLSIKVKQIVDLLDMQNKNTSVQEGEDEDGKEVESIGRPIRPQIVVSTDLNTYKSAVKSVTRDEGRGTCAVGETFDVKVYFGKGTVEILVVDANNDFKRMGMCVLNFALSKGRCTTWWTDTTPTGLPMCAKFNEDGKPWELFLPLKGNVTSAKLSMEVSPIKWSFDDEAAQSSSLSPIRREPSTVVLTLVKARYLEAKDRGGTSDPYAVVKYAKGTFVAKTPVIPKTTAPLWTETFVMERAHGRNGDFIDVDVFDKDKVKDESLGKCKISLKELKYGMNVREWKYLKNARSGQLFYSVTLRKGTPSALSREDVFENVGGNTLVVSVIEAKNLVRADKSGDSDPYVTLEYNKTKKKSEVIMDDLNPKFNFNASFNYASGKGQQVALTIKDWNRIGKANKSIGQVSIDVERLQPGESKESWLQLEGVPTGSVLVGVYRTKPIEGEEDEGGMPEQGQEPFSPSPVKRKKSIFSFKVKSPRKVSMIG